MSEIKKETNLETCTMLTLSTGHIKEPTTVYLNNPSRKELAVYPKLDFGWFIYLNSEYLQDELEDVPSDLRQVIEFTKENGCDVLCLDCDGPVMEQLPFYEW